jgi:hypothetical protein
MCSMMGHHGAVTVHILLSFSPLCTFVSHLHSVLLCLGLDSPRLFSSNKPPIPKALVSVMLSNIIIAHKQTCGVHDSCLKSHPLLLRPNNRSNLRHWHHNLRHGGLLRLHLETKFLAKWPQALGKELFNSVMTPND